MNITIKAKRASEPGALSGHEVKCECGWSATTSIGYVDAQTIAQGHSKWHKAEKKPRKPRRMSSGEAWTEWYAKHPEAS